MPKKYPKEERRAALGYLSMYSGNIDTVHQITGIPHRTLRRWRKQMEAKVARRQRITSDADTKRSLTPQSGQLTVISPDFRSKQRDPAAATDTSRTQPQRPAVATDTTGTQPQRPADITDTTGTQPHDAPDRSFAAPPDERSNRGVPGRAYPYPVGEEPEPEPDPRYAEFQHLRDLLMQYAKELAANLKPDDPDISQRTLALTRILDRLQRLDEMIPEANHRDVIRFEYVYDGMVHIRPPWEEASEEEGKLLETSRRQALPHTD